MMRTKRNGWIGSALLVTVIFLGPIAAQPASAFQCAGGVFNALNVDNDCYNGLGGGGPLQARLTTGGSIFGATCTGTYAFEGAGSESTFPSVTDQGIIIYYKVLKFIVSL